MRVGYLHIGPATDGVRRYGKLLANEMARRQDVTVLEANVTLEGNRRRDKSVLTEAARQLNGSDIVHLQFNQRLWGEGWSKLLNLRLFTRHCSPPYVVTLHDVYPQKSFTRALAQVVPNVQLYSVKAEGQGSRVGESRRRRPTLRVAYRFLRKKFGPDSAALSWVLKHAVSVLVCSKEEETRLQDWLDPERIEIIPHFVEARKIGLRSSRAKEMLGLAGFRVLTLLGWIHQRKGHPLLIRALADLPDDIMVVIAGGARPRHKEYLESLRALARREGVEDRVLITGYLPEEELELYLMATDLAVCPFSRLSASGSLSTWLSVGRPILASDSPQIAEYNALSPGAIRIFKPYTWQALGKAIRELLHQREDQQDPAIVRLRERLSISNVADQHLRHYRVIIERYG